MGVWAILKKMTCSLQLSDSVYSWEYNTVGNVFTESLPGNLLPAYRRCQTTKLVQCILWTSPDKVPRTGFPGSDVGLFCRAGNSPSQIIRLITLWTFDVIPYLFPPASAVESIKSVRCVCLCIGQSALSRLNHLSYGPEMSVRSPIGQEYWQGGHGAGGPSTLKPFHFDWP